jgi:serine/threonine protein kinase
MNADDKTRLLPDMAKTNVGTQLSGIYELDERIASGGMGEVYRGHNIQTGDHVAIKIVLPEFARDQTILSLFRKEASILNHLSHDAIVRYHVFTIDPGIGRPYLAMEFVDGESLFDIIRRGAMPTEDVRKLCHRLASGLSFVHEAGAVHRDLSPDNIILPGGRVERAKIIDFGIARSATVGGETLIGGKFAGKYNYVSPEQLGLYGGEVSERSDIYSLGLVLAAVLRGKPLEMSGSQFEIVEKRRTIPDLSDIDDDFRPIIEAMLQPDPPDRPTSTEIARMTRADVLTDIDGTAAPRSIVPRDRATVRPQTGHTAPPDPWSEPPSANIEDRSAASVPLSQAVDEPRFVPHMPPAHLSQPRPAAVVASRAPAPARSTNFRNIAIAAAAAVVIASGATAYLGDFWTPAATPDAGQTSRLTPDLSTPPKTEKAAPDSQSAENAVPSQTQTKGPEASFQSEPDVARDRDEESLQEADGIADPQVPIGETLSPPVTPLNNTKSQGKDAQPIGKISDAQTSIEESPTPSAKAPSTANDQGQETSQAAENSLKSPISETDAQPLNRPNATASQNQDSAGTANPRAETKVFAPSTNQSNVANEQLQTTDQPLNRPNATASQGQDSAETANSRAETEVFVPSTNQSSAANEQGQKTDQPASNEQSETTVAMNVPKPEVPAADAIDEVAERISWLRNYSGGDCFYASATSATDKAIEIEGFATAVEPFIQMMEAFREKFHVEPDINVRLIEPAQCGVTEFLRSLGATAAEKPQLALDRTSVPNGSPISGTLETLGGLRSNLLLIDHKGMAFNLDERVIVQSGKATFSIPIGLGAADQAAGKAVPQIIVAVTGASDINAATFSNPTPAAVALPKILAEIQEKGLEFSATAKYFRLGG